MMSEFCVVFLVMLCVIIRYSCLACVAWSCVVCQIKRLRYPTLSCVVDAWVDMSLCVCVSVCNVALNCLRIYNARWFTFNCVVVVCVVLCWIFSEVVLSVSVLYQSGKIIKSTPSVITTTTTVITIIVLSPLLSLAQPSLCLSTC